MKVISLKSMLALVLCCISAHALNAQAAEQLEIDLSEDVRLSTYAEPGTVYDVTIRNMTQNVSYAVTIAKSPNEVAVFDLGLFAPAGKTTFTASANSRTIASAFKVQLGFTHEVKVEELDNQGVARKTWRVAVSGGGLGAWTVSYGFNFIPNQDDSFYSMQNPNDAAQFLITQKQDREEFDFAPSIFFRWRPEEPGSWERFVPNMFGLGFDFDDPLVFAGWGFEVGRNVTLAIGGVVHKQARLNGKYEVGQALATSLDETQLVENTYELNGFIGISFRFGSNPFNQGE